ncbi:MAG TPA: GGDEF domain-containing protein [Lachnospiraceae bacterium]|nr:GGDEF domain-containing protein [Lachnospiraceae bacterium]
MQEQKFVKIFRTAKIIQLCILLGIELFFFLVLTYNPNLARQIYSNKSLFTLCAITWILMIFNLLCLLFDFTKLRAFAAESHALNKVAYLDNLTGIPNRHSLDAVFQTYATPDSLLGVGCAMFTISNLKEVNETQGHSTGDTLILDFCNIFEEIGDSFGFVGRNGGNEFVAVINDCNEQVMKHFFTTLQNSINIYNNEHSKAPLLLSSSYTLNEEEMVKAFTQLLTVTYNKLYPTDRK